MAATNVSMATHGVDLVTLGIVDDTGKLVLPTNGGLGIDGLYSPHINAQGTTVANITGLETPGTLQWANNQAKRITTSKSAPSVALTFLDIDFLEMQSMLGYVQDKDNGGWVLQTPKPNVAMLIQSTSFDGATVYEGFAKGNVILPARSHGTDTATEVDESLAFTYTAFVPDADVFLDLKGKKQPYKVWTDEDQGFDKDKMMVEVFGGYPVTDDRLAAPADIKVAATADGATVTAD